MDRYLTTLSPKKSSVLSKEPLGPLADVLGLNESRILIPQSPEKLSPQKRSPQRLASLTESELNSSTADKSRLSLQCVIKSQGLRDDFYSTLLAPHPLKPQLAIAIRSSVQYWSCQFGYDMANIPPDMGHVMCMAYTTNGLLAVGYTMGIVVLYDDEIESVICSHRIGNATNENYPTCMTTNPQNNHLYIGTSKGDLVMLDIVTVYRTRFNLIKETTQVAADIISGMKSNGKVLAVGSNDGVVTLWNTVEPELPMVGQVKHKAAVKAIEFVPNQPFFITGGGRADRCINIWSLHTYELHHRFEVPSQVTGLIWVGRNELFVALGHARGKHLKLGEIWRIERGSSCKLVDVEDTAEPARAVYAVKSLEGLVVGTNTKLLYYYNWKERPVGGFGLGKNLHLTPLR